MNNFDNIIGYDNIKHELNIVLDKIINHQKYEALNACPTRGILLYGEPGTGKTTIAKEFIKLSGLQSFQVRKNKPDGEFVKHINNVFEKAYKYTTTNNKAAIVFLDDMDKFANSDEYRRNCEEYVTIQSCIDEYKNSPIIVIATANDISVLPKSLHRVGRFDKVLEVENPSGEDAVKIVEYYLRKKRHLGDVNYEEIAQILSGRSCAQLEAVINEAATIVAYNNKEKIEMVDIIKAAMRVLYDAPESLGKTEDKYLINVAYHEAGHAVVGEILEPGSVNLITVASYDGPTSGITSYNQNKDYYKSMDYMENRVMTLLGGRAANEVVFGVSDVGCHNDLNRAYEIVTRFIDDYCTLGFNNWESITSDSSDGLRSRKETLVSYQMQQYYNRVKRLLIENRLFLDEVAKQLINNTTLTRNDMLRIKESC